ncbi:hypothetical protein K4L44_01045 [Halosquirtibacter laminarini]|uniref:Uncharacterized protein n=1 Tax=Halosquirtibacter laminarini TaxID=3374600 RepID=A0AC61NFT9_9BACT|nr:hypothetical protein K4L44_01045 [Prolixibacteraceae bacterium]
MKAIINMNPHLKKQKIIGGILTLISTIAILVLGSTNWEINAVLVLCIWIGVILYTNFFNLNTCNIILQPKSIVIKWKGKLKPEWIHLNHMNQWGIEEETLFIETKNSRRVYSIKFLSDSRKESLKEALSQYSKYIEKDFILKK